jgi:hypothetical protein
MSGATVEIRTQRRSLGDVIRHWKRDSGKSLDALCAMSAKRDPYRQDTPAGHRNAAWVAEMIEKYVVRKTIHARGLHYALVTAQPIKPNGEIYRNNEADWVWLSEDALTTARWLGYVDFDRITDERNSPPVIRIPTGMERIAISTMPEIRIPLAESIAPRIVVEQLDRYDPGHWRLQPYTLVICGEKTSLDPVITPIANRVGAGVFLPNGNMSDSMIARMVDMIEATGRRRSSTSPTSTRADTPCRRNWRGNCRPCATLAGSPGQWIFIPSP